LRAMASAASATSGVAAVIVRLVAHAVEVGELAEHLERANNECRRLMVEVRVALDEGYKFGIGVAVCTRIHVEHGLVRLLDGCADERTARFATAKALLVRIRRPTSAID